MEVQINQSVIELIESDITGLAVDCIVNPANAQLVLGGGVAGAIARKGGDAIQSECTAIGPISVGDAVITSGGNLKAGHVIHAVGPRAAEGDEEKKLRRATANSLKLADENDINSIAFPAISTGIFGSPMDKCAEIMLSETIDYLKGDTSIQRVIFCLFDEKALAVFVQQLQVVMG
jgi:O-acetyl-ADP-ribose deacetylase (regulator of RNase III)